MKIKWNKKNVIAVTLMASIGGLFIYICSAPFWICIVWGIFLGISYPLYEVIKK